MVRGDYDDVASLDAAVRGVERVFLMNAQALGTAAGPTHDLAMVGACQRAGVKRIVKLGAFVASDPAFTEQPKVANGASELMVQIFGEAGKHARSAVGVPVLPLGASVEVDAIVAVRPA